MKGLNIKKIRTNKGLSQSDFAQSLGVSLRTVQNWEAKEDNISKKIELLIKTKYAENTQKKNVTNLDFKPTANEKEKKVPYYDIDVTSSITTSFSDVVEEPSFYVDYQPFNDCTAYVNNYGDSMFPKYKNGERLAVKQISNFDVISWGETYLVITNENANNLKTVKDVHPHDDFDKIILRASNPAYKGDTPINKEDIIAMFAVKGKISQNFI